MATNFRVGEGCEFLSPCKMTSGEASDSMEVYDVQISSSGRVIGAEKGARIMVNVDGHEGWVDLANDRGEPMLEHNDVNASRASNLSYVSYASRTSHKSTFSMPSGLKRMMSSKSSVRKPEQAPPAELVLEVATVCETISLVTVRQEESLESAILTELPRGLEIEILEIGDGRRTKIAAIGIEGWISYKTKVGEPLIKKVRKVDVGEGLAHHLLDDFDVGGQHEVKSIVTLRQHEVLDSEVVAELRPGTLIRIMQLGALDKRRAKVATEVKGEEGWISLSTKKGELLVGKVDDSEKTNAASNNTKVKALLEAARGGDVLKVKEAVDPKGHLTKWFAGKADINASDIRGKTALTYAAAFGNLDVVIYLLGRPSIEANALDDTQKSALHHASKKARRTRLADQAVAQESGDAIQATIAVALIRASVYVEARDHNGCTALMFAVANGDAQVMKVLLNAEANVNVKDFEGHTPLDYATNFGHVQLAQDLRNKGALDHEEEHNYLDADGPQIGEDGEISIPVADVGAAGKMKKKLSKKKAKPKSEHHGDDDGEEEHEYVEGEHVEEGDGEVKKVKAKKKVTKKKKTEDGEAHAEGGDLGEDGAHAEEEGEHPAEECAEGEAKKVKAKKKVVKKKAAAGDAADHGEAGEAADAAAEGDVAAGEDGEVKAKKKVKKKAAPKAAAPTKRPSMSSGMAEMANNNMEEAVHQAEIAVPVAAPVEPEAVVDHAAIARDNARAKLEAVMAGSASIKELEAAIATAKETGMEQAPIDKAEGQVAALKERVKAQDKLQAAMASLSVTDLKDAIAKAEQNQVAAAEIDKAKAVLKNEEPKQAAREKLKVAQNSGDTNALKIAIEEAKSVKLSEDELSPFEELLSGAESKEAAMAALLQAIEDRNVPQLKFAIQQGRDAKCDEQKIAEAEAVLKLEEPKEQAREMLREACEKSPIDLSVLQAAIEAGEKAGLLSTEMQVAKDVVAKEAVKAEAMAKVQARIDCIPSVDATSIDDLKALKDQLTLDIQAAKDAGCEENLLGNAEGKRRKVHNNIEDIKGSIRVFCRVRPLSSKEKNQGDTSITNQIDSMTVELTETAHGAQIFAFDAVFMPGTQDQVFEDCKDLVQSAVDGYNVTIFAYGQTGAGKTFTMYGVPGMEGQAPRTIDEIFLITDRDKGRYTFTIMASMLELYRNDLFDLLVKKKDSVRDGGKENPKLQVRLDKQGMVQIEHLIEVEVTNAPDLSAVLERGNGQRTVCATAMNAESSRSHSLFIVKIISVNKETKAQTRGKILMCDLAGSERLKKSEVTGDQQKEAIEINKSLTALGDVIEGLTKHAKQIPYRNHKLTQVMQDSLGGSAKTLMFVNCSPASSNCDETTMSLKYATRAKKITNTAKKAT